ncbi:hypothetical protein GCK72_009083 [Caenorhabditis remanei]|uniref:MARVEL domain-containing protein n=1 Tax=Caenorhabditis remanei TaxID=31234 RepID=A0A6A5H2K9_CAERE|nr:hypothetical protein GCK72_009083 [Caenorhabditis remanei]KAF1760833.1 hypothetical protein GCK72_009083 [Caenorhabditis remanei]
MLPLIYCPLFILFIILVCTISLALTGFRYSRQTRWNAFETAWTVNCILLGVFVTIVIYSSYKRNDAVLAIYTGAILVSIGLWMFLNYTLNNLDEEQPVGQTHVAESEL